MPLGNAAPGLDEVDPGERLGWGALALLALVPFRAAIAVAGPGRA